MMETELLPAFIAGMLRQANAEVAASQTSGIAGNPVHLEIHTCRQKGGTPTAK